MTPQSRTNVSLIEIQEFSLFLLASSSTVYLVWVREFQCIILSHVAKLHGVMQLIHSVWLHLQHEGNVQIDIGSSYLV